MPYFCSSFFRLLLSSGVYRMKFERSDTSFHFILTSFAYLFGRVTRLLTLFKQNMLWCCFICNQWILLRTMHQMKGNSVLFIDETSLCFRLKFNRDFRYVYCHFGMFVSMVAVMIGVAFRTTAFYWNLLKLKLFYHFWRLVRRKTGQILVSGTIKGRLLDGFRERVLDVTIVLSKRISIIQQLLMSLFVRSDNAMTVQTAKWIGAYTAIYGW